MQKMSKVDKNKLPLVKVRSREGSLPSGNREIILYPQEPGLICKDAIHIRDFSTDQGGILNLQTQDKLGSSLDTTIYPNYLSSQDGLVDVALLVEDGDPALTLGRMKKPHT